MGSDRTDGKEKKRELISVLMESSFYFELKPKDRLDMIRSLIQKMARLE